ncbi:MAG: bifunctional glutamate N-acetyltransferase/amino-acid acetyltransferase ArgJ [Chthoniobacterales bacterium]
MRRIDGSVCAPRGFRAAAVFCDIKRLGTGKGSEKGRKDDLGLIVSDVPAAVAGMFTLNRVRAAPVELCAKHIKAGMARAIVANSGNANACTGSAGMRDAKRMAQLTADALSFKQSTVFVASTGRIGVPLPMSNVVSGIHAAAMKLERSTEAARHVAEAIMTSDTRAKEIAVEIAIDGVTVRIGGTCKGAGMIEPRLRASLHATMLAFITTDAAISARSLQRALNIAIEQSFNRISVDGDTSTNDTVLILANGLAENRPLRGQALASFQEALNFVTLHLAKMIVADGEGVSRLITLHVRGARNAAAAETVARAVANSALVKTSWCGGDPNWGRILCAVGYSGVRVDQGKISIGYSADGGGDTLFGFRRGAPTDVPFAKLTAITSQAEFDVWIDLHAGKSATTFYTCDLTEEYVAFNKGDITDPRSLGG